MAWLSAEEVAAEGCATRGAACPSLACSTSARDDGGFIREG
jgi:hypothetical protein